MNISSLENLPEVKILRPRKLGDHRGFFSETYNYQQLKNLGEDLKFVQDNQSESRASLLAQSKFSLIEALNRNGCWGI